MATNLATTTLEQPPVDELGQPYVGGEGGTAGGGQVTAPLTPGGVPAVPAVQQPTGYDPNNPTPYQPASMPQVQQPYAQEPVPTNEPQYLGAVNHAGAVAYIGDKLMRGIMQGRSDAMVMQAMRAKKESSGLQSIYDQSAQDLYRLAQNGVDQKSPQFQDARNRVDASWGALMDSYGKHVQPDQGKKQSSTGNKGPNLLQRMFNAQDPAATTEAWYTATKMMGPPVLHQIAPMLTPEYQAKAQLRAQTQGVGTQTAETAATTQGAVEQNRARYLELSNKQDRTAKEDTELNQRYNTMLGMPNAKGAIAPIAMKKLSWTPLPGAQALQKIPGTNQMGLAFRNGVGDMKVMPLEGYTPSVFDQKGLTRVAPDANGNWTQWAVDKFGNEIPQTRKPATGLATIISKMSSSTTNPLGETTSHNQTTSRGPAQLAQTPEEHQAAASVPATSNTSVIPPAVPRKAGAPPLNPATRAPIIGNPNKTVPTSQTPNLPPADPEWKPDPASAVQVWAKKLYDNESGTMKLSDVPAKDVASKNPDLRTAVQKFMTANNMSVNSPDTMAERASVHAMKDAYPSIDTTLAYLRQAMGIKDGMTPQQQRKVIESNSGLMDSLVQRFSYGQYANGISPGDLKSKINQLTAFDALTGASGWIKMGRNRQVFDKIQEHLPQAKTDSIGMMYDKLNGMRDLFDQQIRAYNDRHHQPTAPPSGSPQISVGVGSNQPPNPQTHIFDSAAWKAANQQGDVEAAKAEAKKQGYAVK